MLGEADDVLGEADDALGEADDVLGEADNVLCAKDHPKDLKKTANDRKRTRPLPPQGAASKEPPRASNNFHTLPQTSLVALAQVFGGAVNGAPTSYGLTAIQAGTVTTTAAAYNTAITNYNDAKAAFRAASQAKAAAKLVLVDLIAEFAKIAYAYPNITDQLIADAGLAIYKTPATITPKTPTQLVADPFATGDVDLSWNRSGNPYGVAFGIETRGETGEWALLTVTDATKFTVTGFTPGTAAWFRIVAINRGIRSTPSLEVAIYHDGNQQVQLQAA